MGRVNFRLLILYANSLDPDQDRWEKKLILKKKTSRRQQKLGKLPSSQIVKEGFDALARLHSKSGSHVPYLVTYSCNKYFILMGKKINFYDRHIIIANNIIKSCDKFLWKLYERTCYTYFLHSHLRIRTNNMANNSVTILETMVNSFTNADELMDFAATWGLQDSLAVRYKLFQMNTQYDDTFVNEQLESLLQTFLGETEQSANVRMEEDGSIKALFFDKEMEALEQTFLDDGEWNPVTQVHFIFTL